MKLKPALVRLHYTISNGNKPNQSDVDAFNSVLDHINKTQEETIQENILFAKLYAYLLGKYTMHYESVDQANKHLNNLLSQRMDYITGILEMELKAMEVRNIIPDPILDIPAKEIPDKMAQYSKFSKEFQAGWDWWNQDNVTAHLNTNINLSIQKFKNYD